MNDPFLSFKSIRYFSGLDALRAISVIAVIWSHVAGVQGVVLLNQGRRGVDLFFAISGFLVTTLLLREYGRSGRISLRDFYIRRTLRIFPLYYAVLALYCILVFLTLSGTPKASEFWGNLPAFLTYTSNWFVNDDGRQGGATFYLAWSLATEEQFYMFWPPLIVLILSTVKMHWALALTAMVLLGMQLVAAPYDRVTLLGTVIASLSPAILFGAVFAVLLNNRSAFNFVYPVLGHKFMAPAAALLLLGLLQLDAPMIVFRFVMALLVASVCVREDTHLHPVLTWKPAAFIGTISYGMYLMHMLAANAVRPLVGHQFGIDVFIATLAAVTIAAHFSYRYFEAPILRQKSRFGGKGSLVGASLGESAKA